MDGSMFDELARLREVERTTDEVTYEWSKRCQSLENERDALLCRLQSAPSAIMDARDVLGVCAPDEESFPALYAMQGKRVRLVVEDAETDAGNWQ